MQRPWGRKESGLFGEWREGHFGWRTDKGGLRFERLAGVRGQRALKAVTRTGFYPRGCGKPRKSFKQWEQICNGCMGSVGIGGGSGLDPELFVVVGKRITWDIFRGTGKVARGWGLSEGSGVCDKGATCK